MRSVILLVNHSLRVDVDETSAEKLTHIQVLFLVYGDGIQYKEV